MNQIKEAFQKVKEDINSLRNEIFNLQKELQEIQLSILTLIKTQNSQQINYNNKNNYVVRQTDNQTDRHFDTSTHIPTNNTKNKSFRQINSTDNTSSTDTSTHILPFKDLKRQYIESSIGNQWVSTDRQTIRQTDTSTDISQEKALFTDPFIHNHPKQSINTTNLKLQKEQFFPRETLKKPAQLVPDTSIVLNQLDTIKKDIRLKIKRLTNQEMLVLSSIYQLEDQGFIVDYSLLSSKLNLSESSIRDYIQRIISKGLNLTKEKVNNKKIIVHISSDFRKLASLETLFKLREL